MSCCCPAEGELAVNGIAQRYCAIDSPARPMAPGSRTRPPASSLHVGKNVGFAYSHSPAPGTNEIAPGSEGRWRPCYCSDIGNTTRRAQRQCRTGELRSGPDRTIPRPYRCPATPAASSIDTTVRPRSRCLHPHRDLERHHSSLHGGGAARWSRAALSEKRRTLRSAQRVRNALTDATCSGAGALSEFRANTAKSLCARSEAVRPCRADANRRNYERIVVASC